LGTPLRLFAVASDGGGDPEPEQCGGREPATARLLPISRTDQTMSKVVLIVAGLPARRARSPHSAFAQ